MVYFMINKYKLKITGKNSKRFIKNLISKNILLYYVDFRDKYSIIIVDDEGYNKILDIKTSYDIKIVDKYGFNKIFDLLSKYLIFFICIIMGIVLIKILSNVLLEIKIESPKSEIRELVLNDLNYYGIRKYHFKVSYKEKEQIIRKILRKEKNNLEWLEIDSVGSKYIVKVSERIKNDIKKSNKAQSIVASRDAYIVSIMAHSGEVKVYKNQYVKKGDVLISGFIYKDDKIMKKVRASGNVFGEVWYQVNITVPTVYKEDIRTRKYKDRLEIKFLDKSFFLFNFHNYKNYDVERKTIFKNKLLPISFNYSRIYEIKKIRKNYRDSKGLQEAIKLAIKKLKMKLGPKDSIISKNVLKKEEKNSKIEIDIFFKVKQDITDTVNIDNIDITKQEGVKDESSN